MGDFSLSTLFASGVLSALIAGIWQYFAKQKDYKDDYYKKIIEKRLKTYECFEIIYSQHILYTVIYNTPTDPSKHEEKKVLLCCSSCDEASKILKTLTPLGVYSIWHSNTLSNLFIKFLNELKEIAEYKGNDFFGMICKKSDGLELLVQQLSKTISNDMLTLCDVKTFLKNKKIIKK